MDNAPAQRLNVRERLGHIAHGEVRQRERIARTTSTCVDTDRRGPQTRLPALSFLILANLELDTEESTPKAQRALGIVGGELDEGGWGVLHEA
jgi:hypothetical protein